MLNAYEFLREWGSCTIQLIKRVALVTGVGLLAWLALAIVLSLIATPSKTGASLERKDGKRLVVVVHGLSGRSGIQPTVKLVSDTFPRADLLTIEYDARPLSNADAYEITNFLEDKIHRAHEAAQYESIVLLGHSMGAMLVRKALLWGNGLEEDRAAKKGARPWAERVVRVVSLAGINRGWSIDPWPDKMRLLRYVGIWLGESVARLTATGKLLLSMQRGSSFIADSRVQWIRLALTPAAGGAQRRLPQVIHLLGDSDDIVSRTDARDLSVAKDTVFVTLANTNHASIAEAVRGGQGADADRRRKAIGYALLGDLGELSPDKDQELKEDLAVTHVIYLMHGIRDYGGWTDKVRSEIETRKKNDQSIAVINKKYGYFPMLRFLLYWDRQKYVRLLMDEYTENLAKYPRAERFDFAGHSNGTYILASALQRYSTLSVGLVFFAGSVVPKHYPWRELLGQKRVQCVVNVVGSGDWVVGIFPKLFEQFADWLSVRPTVGVLDLGSAGFRGFEDAYDPRGRVLNLTFAEGDHSTGVAVENPKKLEAIVAYLLDGDLSGASVFEDAPEQWGWLDVASNVTWLVWIILLSIVFALAALAFMLHRIAGAAFVLIVLGLLVSI